VRLTEGCVRFTVIEPVGDAMRLTLTPARDPCMELSEDSGDRGEVIIFDGPRGGKDPQLWANARECWKGLPGPGGVIELTFELRTSSRESRLISKLY